MSMIVQHNMSSMNANRNLKVSGKKLKKSTEKLSSGYKINCAADNAAGLAISEKMRGQIRGLEQASANAEDGISLIQTAEGALGETQSLIHRMRELAVQAASDTNTEDDRSQIQNEIDQLTQEVDKIANTTEFNTKKLLNGESIGSISSKAGTNKAEGTFASSGIRLETSVSAATLAGYTDVIRIEITKDISDASVIMSADHATFTSLYGNYGNTITDCNIKISANGVTISGLKMYSAVGASLSAGNTVSEAGKGSDTTFAFTGDVTQLKAGDIITISLGKLTETKSAETGKDALRLQIGANAGQEVALGINDMGTKALSISKDGKALNVSTQNGASMAIEAYDMAIQKVSTERAKMGAMQNRLEHTIANLDTSAENLQAAESSLRDTDMAEEMTEYSKNNILMQAGQSMLAQANQSNQGVLGLLQ